MGKLIRHGVFETNSSSTHSLVIDRNGDYTSITPDDNNEIVIKPEDFGWQFEAYQDPKDKLAYLFIYVREWVETETRKNVYHNMITEMVKEHTGASRVYLASETDGYIDHQSVEDGQLEPYFRDPQLLKDFVFGRNSVLKTGNDNGEGPDGWYD